MTSAAFPEIVRRTEIPELELLSRGKVRDIYQLDDRLLIVATDRLSAFDVVLPDGIPGKGQVLTQLSAFWFDRLRDTVANHLITTEVARMPAPLPAHGPELAGRSMLVRKAQRFDVECVVRGYLIGSGWNDYQRSGEVCGVPLPEGLRQADRLPEAIFTPSTKAESGHDENVPFETMEKIVGVRWAPRLRDVSLQLYRQAATYALERGIIIADTKFEFGLIGGELTLIDEALTPDSSRFWPADRYAPGHSPPSFDKQFVRDYLLTLDWDKRPPGPVLPGEIVRKTAGKYAEAFQRLTGTTIQEAIGGAG